MSLLTNPEVAVGKKSRGSSWVISCRASAASTAGLTPGNKIIRVDREMVSKLSKAEMLATLLAGWWATDCSWKSSNR